ncbi:MAG: hypothetical protein AAFY07_14330 [Pseudomonadota bacterium]
MSWDIFVQDFGDYASIDDIPDSFQPRPIGQRAYVIDTIRRVCPEVSFDDTDWGVLEGDGWSIEFNINGQDPCESLALHVRGEDGSIPVIACLLNELGVRGIESAESKFFEEAVAPKAFAKWRAYRDQVLGSGA